MSALGENKMKTIGNILWFIFGGLEMAIITFLEALILCITIVFIPVGLQLFKVAGFLLWPMGKKVSPTNKPNGFKMVINVIWCIFGGLVNALVYLILGALFCITIIGIPFGLQYFKLARFVLTPLGYGFEKA